MISAIYIFTLKGELLLQRAYASPVPPAQHVKAFSRTVLEGRAFSELAPVVCVGNQHASAGGGGASSSACSVSSFSCFIPPCIASSASAPNVFLSSSSAPTVPANAGSHAAGVVPTSAIVRGRREGRWGGRGSDDRGIVYVAALRQNANVACVLEVLRRLAALVQAFYVASLGCAATGPILPASYTQDPAELPVPSSLARSATGGGAAAGAEETVRQGPQSGSFGGLGDAGPAGSKEALFSAKRQGSSLLDAMRRGLSTGGAAVLGSSAGVAGGGSGSLVGYVDESFVRKHYVLLYEILDEAIDGGFPQLLDLATLRKFTIFGNGPGFHWPPDHVGGPAGGLVSAASLRRGGEFGTGGGAGGSGFARAFSRSGVQRDGSDLAASKRITSQVTGACSWRAPGIHYKRNEVFIDVVECVNVLASQNGVVLRADVNGEVHVNCRLSGMPECKFGLNDRVPLQAPRAAGPEPPGPAGSGSVPAAGLAGGPGRPKQPGTERKDDAAAAQGVMLDDCRFHQCVRLSKFDLERTISFIPPDGSFRLMTYRISEGVSLPFKIFPLLQERSESRMECVILLKALFERNISATNVEVIIPCPPNLCELQLLHVGIGKAALDNAQQAVVWKIRRYPGAMEYLLRYELHLASQRLGALSRRVSAAGRGSATPHGERSDEAPGGGAPLSRWKRPPLTLRFTLHMYTASGLCIRYLKITEKSNYRSIKWIRYLTKAGTYQHRL
ncbi:hypothetical protein BESB_010340 [Besnoitia besnoiti]|uniref:MHD domain-containing protein n=1 Tax=Besnoitia besnoiti TaxID=94643 RepID=A0A2A9MR15_BESBE|nr:hypothetical protein BESB_010340 [Besnoitia besnoiti]PFH38692.1 hypothetical protein BESB_010340 [Besnoitia besnoiti]